MFARNRFTHLNFETQFIEEVVGKFPRLVKILCARASVQVALAVGHFDPTEPFLLGAVFELIKDDFSVLKRLLVDDLIFGHAGRSFRTAKICKTVI